MWRPHELRFAHMSLAPKHRWGLAIGGVFLALLLGAVFTFGSLDVPFEPGNWRAVISLTAVSSFIFAALMIFSLIFSSDDCPAADRTQQRNPRSKIQNQDVDRGDGALAVAGAVHVFCQLFAAESHARAVVSAATGDCFRANASVDDGFWQDHAATNTKSGAASAGEFGRVRRKIC